MGGFESKATTDLSDKEKDEIEKMYRDNYKEKSFFDLKYLALNRTHFATCHNLRLQLD